MKTLKGLFNPLFNGTFSILLAGMLLTVSGCKKETETPPTTDTVESAEDNAKMESEMNNVMDVVNAAQKNSFGKTSQNDFLPPCATITVDSLSNPKTKTITFSDPNGVNGACLCNDGVYRKGSIKVAFYGEKDQPGFQRIITLVDYYAGPAAETNFMGTKTWTYEGMDGDAKKFTVKVEGGKAVNAQGTATWQCQQTVWQTKGLDTPEIIDDAYLVRGTGAGVNRKGVSYSTAIDENKPLVKDFDKCGWQIGDHKLRGRFISGVSTLTNSNGKTMTLDYDPIGGEPCDRIARITINGHSTDITLP